MESLMKDVGDCGLFQVLAVNIIYLSQLLMSFSMIFFAFAIYNPGWTCADNVFNNITEPYYRSETTNLSTSPSINATVNDLTYNEESCQVFESCRDVRFNPETSTLVTEWGLVCGRAWIVNVIISIQMIAVLVGSFFAGYLNDRFGRKLTLLAGIFLHTVFHFIGIFSVSWTMFALSRLLIGVAVALFRFFACAYSCELISPKWRGPIASHPMFPTASILLAIICMVTKDWVQVEIIITCASAITFMLMLWIPESLRWLAVNGKEEEAYKVATKIAKMNKREVPDRFRVRNIVEMYKSMSPDTKKHRMIDLFRKGFRMSAAIIAFLFMTMNMTYYAMSIGAKSLPGNLYVTMIIMFSTDYIGNICASLTGNKLGRRLIIVSPLVLFTVCLLVIVILDKFTSGSVRDNGIIVLAICVRVTSSVTWFMLAAYMTELYPTVIRGTISGWGSMHAQIGAVIGPFLIPSTPEYLYICYLIMGCMFILSCVLFFFLEDTSAKSLDDTWANDVSKNEPENIDAEQMGSQEKEENHKGTAVCYD